MNTPSIPASDQREPVLFCWSGGKDSAMALHALLQQKQFRVVALLTTVTEGYDRISIIAIQFIGLARAVPAAELVAAVRAAGIEVADDTAWDDAFFAAFLARVEPAIAALDHAVILEAWPAPLAALARRSDATTALRFEAYVGGIELANAFDELTDPIEQRARFVDEQRVRRDRGRPVYPIDDKLIAALVEGLPPSAGIALGFDRLVMLATGATAIDQVLTFTAEEL